MRLALTYCSRNNSDVVNDVRIGETLAGKYRVERILGQGGMGTVVAAEHLTLQHMVALKFMRAKAMEYDDGIQRFLREAKIVASLRSENITRVMDLGQFPDGTLYMVMEYLEGIDFKTLVRDHGPLGVEDSVDYLLQVCSGLSEAHDSGIIHRDLKPANLFLTQRPTGAVLIKILDFGISKLGPFGANDGLETEQFGTMGSPPFMSPEQTKSLRDTDARSDIWSLGVILYHLLSGTLPFKADNTAETVVQILSVPMPSLRERAPWVPASLERVVSRCLTKDPDARYARVSQLAAALMPYASVEGRALVKGARVRVSECMPTLSPEDIAVYEADAAVADGPPRLNVAAILHQMQLDQQHMQAQDQGQGALEAAALGRTTMPGGGVYAFPTDMFGDWDGDDPSDHGTDVVEPAVYEAAAYQSAMVTHDDPAAYKIAGSRSRRPVIIGLVIVLLLALGGVGVASWLGERGSGQPDEERSTVAQPGDDERTPSEQSAANTEPDSAGADNSHSDGTRPSGQKDGPADGKESATSASDDAPVAAADGDSDEPANGQSVARADRKKTRSKSKKRRKVRKQRTKGKASASSDKTDKPSAEDSKPDKKPEEEPGVFDRLN